MKYKHQKDIKIMLFDEHRVESDPSVLNTAFNMRDEIDEVYRKAEAFDAIVDIQNRAEGEMWLTEEWEFGIKSVIKNYQRSEESE